MSWVTEHWEQDYIDEAWRKILNVVCLLSSLDRNF
jgi:hypothetical protein